MLPIKAIFGNILECNFKASMDFKNGIQSRWVPMDELLRRKGEIETRLEMLRKTESELVEQCKREANELEEKNTRYSQAKEEERRLREIFNEKKRKYQRLKCLINQMNDEYRESLRPVYRNEIQKCIKRLNGLEFPYKMNVFQSFDQLKAVPTEIFPNLDQLKNKLLETEKKILSGRLAESINMLFDDSSKLNELIFYINFIIRYEQHFNESLFIPIIFKRISRGFLYHFNSDRETNRIDKPEWFFAFLQNEYAAAAILYNLYTDCLIDSVIEPEPFTVLIEKTYRLIYNKIEELSQAKSNQKRQLALHFADSFINFGKDVKFHYNFIFNSFDVGHFLNKIQTRHIRLEMQRIHELRYIQWFSAYKSVCKDSLKYICKYNELDNDFGLEDVLEPILLHMKTFIDNLRFIEREEVRVTCYLFSALEDLKEFICEEEANLYMILETVPKDLTAESLERIRATNLSVMDLIKRLAVSDVESALRNIKYFTYASEEAKRTIIVDIYKLIEDYKYCVYYRTIEEKMAKQADEYLWNNIVTKIILKDDELEKFERFYQNMKGVFSERNWKCDGGIRAIQAILSGDKVECEMYQEIEDLYRF